MASLFSLYSIQTPQVKKACLSSRSFVISFFLIPPAILYRGQTEDKKEKGLRTDNTMPCLNGNQKPEFHRYLKGSLHR